MTENQNNLSWLYDSHDDNHYACHNDRLDQEDLDALAKEMQKNKSIYLSDRYFDVEQIGVKE